jgi:hypothetical protein
LTLDTAEECKFNEGDDGVDDILAVDIELLLFSVSLDLIDC